MNTRRIEIAPEEVRAGDVLVRSAGAFPVIEAPEPEIRAGRRWVRVTTTRRVYRLNPCSRFEVYREVSR